MTTKQKPATKRELLDRIQQQERELLSLRGKLEGLELALRSDAARTGSASN